MSSKITPDDSMASKQTGLSRRKGSNVWQFEIRIPKALAQFHDGKRSFRISLRTLDYGEAKLQAALRKAEWETKFDNQRRVLEAQKAHHIDSIGPEIAAELGAVILRDALVDDQQLRTDVTAQAGLLRWMELSGLSVPDSPADRFGGMPDALADKLLELHQSQDDETKLALARGKLVDALPALQRAGLKLGIQFNEQTPGIALALQAALKAMRQAASAKVARDRGDVIETPSPSKPLKPQQVYKLRDVFKLWEKSIGVDLADGTVRARELALELYETHTENLPITDVTRIQGDAFRAKLRSLGGASKTARDRMDYVKGLFNYAHTQLGLIPGNPWLALNIKSTTEKRRFPWTTEQIVAFYGQPLFTSYVLPESGKAGADAGYWIPLLGLYTGARLGELCQLQVTDVRQEEGAWLVDINEMFEGQRVKSDAGWRKVPVHSELVRLGFLDYADATKKAGHASLWPRLHLREGKPSHGYSAWFNNVPRKAIKGVTIPDFHSLRHTVRTAMTIADVPEPTQDRITGHALTGSTGTKVYAHVPMRKLVAAVESIQYPFLTLQRVYKVAKGIEVARARLASVEA